MKFFNRSSGQQESNSSKKSGERTLAQLVTLVADEPTIQSRNAFYRALLISKVGARVNNPDPSVHVGQNVVTKDLKIGVPNISGPNGKPMLLVYCDIPGMAEAYPQNTFFEIEGRTVLEMAKSAGCGVIVQNMLDGKESWAGVSKEDVVELLDRDVE